MFDFAWSEIALIGVVALVLIGPKDLPIAIKGVADMVKRARRMAAEFQTHVDDLAREANLHEVRQQINEIRSFDIRGAVEKAVDADGSIRQTFTENPLANTYAPSAPVSDAPSLAESPAPAEPPAPIPTAALTPPAFIPPEVAPPREAVSASPGEPPAFVPPPFVPPPFVPHGVTRA